LQSWAPRQLLEASRLARDPCNATLFRSATCQLLGASGLPRGPCNATLFRCATCPAGARGPCLNSKVATWRANRCSGWTEHRLHRLLLKLGHLVCILDMLTGYGGVLHALPCGQGTVVRAHAEEGLGCRI